MQSVGRSGLLVRQWRNKPHPGEALRHAGAAGDLRDAEIGRLKIRYRVFMPVLRNDVDDDFARGHV